ncbi:MAG: methyltransferase [Longispora sp.]|nr:methyltransferase [Longispora sp. (in: high G+C Gram-positive bacteria)]
MQPTPLLTPQGIDRLRKALRSAEYTGPAIDARLGPEARSALSRNDFRPTLRLLRNDPLDTLIKLYVCGQTVTVAEVERALPLQDVLEAELIEPVPGGLRAGVDLHPYEEWWLLADVPELLRPGQPLRADHVLGLGGAAKTLGLATPRLPVAHALDLGTGCGVQALHLSTHAQHVTGTDLSERALRFAATTAALNGLDWELLHGDLTEPVAGRRFDLVVSNPPFVIRPGSGSHTYRDSDRTADGICAELAGQADELLADGGYLQFLANWAHVKGEPWQERVVSWLAGTSVDGWVIQREVADPMEYVHLWLRDSGDQHDMARAGEWLDWFDEQQIEAVGFGLVTLRKRTGGGIPRVRIEDLRQQIEQPFGVQVVDWFARQDFLRTTDLLSARFTTAPDLRLSTESMLGAEGWAETRRVLTQTRGLHWSEEVDEATAALVASCSGHLPLADQISLLAMAHGLEEQTLTQAAVPVVAHLVERGYLEPVK